jgi:hypothetical protein
MHRYHFGLLLGGLVRRSTRRIRMGFSRALMPVASALVIAYIVGGAALFLWPEGPAKGALHALVDGRPVVLHPFGPGSACDGVSLARPAGEAGRREARAEAERCGGER